MIIRPLISDPQKGLKCNLLSYVDQCAGCGLSVFPATSTKWQPMCTMQMRITRSQNVWSFQIFPIWRLFCAPWLPSSSDPLRSFSFPTPVAWKASTSWSQPICLFWIGKEGAFLTFLKSQNFLNCSHIGNMTTFYVYLSGPVGQWSARRPLTVQRFNSSLPDSIRPTEYKFGMSIPSCSM